MNLEFWKLEGLGNDFVLIDCRKGQQALNEHQAARLANRHSGVGCDQVLMLHPPGGEGLCAYSIRNADGSPAEQCGNGARCIAWWLHLQGEHGPTAVLESPAGPVESRIVGPEMVRVCLAAPPPPDDDDSWPISLDLDGERLDLFPADMGNPHGVVLTDSLPQPGELKRLSAALQASGHYPEGINLGLVQSGDRSTVMLRVFERGAGLTRACGSGACAAAWALIRSGQADSPVSVVQPGGALVIEWNQGSKMLAMTGPARMVFRGEIQWQNVNH